MEKAVGVLEAYELQIVKTLKGRGSLLVETNQGTKILKEYPASMAKVELQDTLQKQITDHAVCTVDSFVRNKEGSLITVDQMGIPYVLKDYPTGRECELKNPEDLKLAAKTLAHIHDSMRLKNACIVKSGVLSMREEFSRHTKQLNKIYEYTRGQGTKTEFELNLLMIFRQFYEQAAAVSKCMNDFPEEMYNEEIAKLCQYGHGEYIHHNILIQGKKISVINFEKFRPMSRIRDLSQFMRKSLEKNNWNVELGLLILQSYENEYKLSELDLQCLYYRLAYPEKFFKVVNHYYNTNKVMISNKNIEKLKALVCQSETKAIFLKELNRYR